MSYKKNILLALFCTLTFTSISLHANQSSSPSQQINQESAEIESTERVISVTEPTKDALIHKRLVNILNSSKKYTDLSVEVDGGFVLLQGMTTEEKYVGWAGEIAKNIEGVVAVINNIDLPSVSFLTYEPIKKELLKLWYKGLEVLPLLVIGILVLLFFFLSSNVVSTLVMRPIKHIAKSELIRIVIHRVISLFIILLGIYFFLRIAGLTQFALAIISGTGVMGLILGFAFRDIAENFISSLLLTIQRPFRLGDVIEVQGHKGVVRKVTARGTTLIDYDGNHIQIPNATIYKNIIQNFSANPRLRGNFIIGIGYDASIKKAQDLGLQLMIDQEAVLDDPEPQVLIDNLGSSTVNLKIYFWIDSHKHSVAKVASILMRLMMRQFEKNGISMPDDAREIIFPQGVPVKMQNDVQAKEEVLDPGADKSFSITKDVTADSDDTEDDLSSDTDDIRQQADSVRDPEEGKNII